MGNEGWIDPTSHFIATGYVNSYGRMESAEVTDNVGTTIDRDKSFSSKSDFATWCKNYTRW